MVKLFVHKLYADCDTKLGFIKGLTKQIGIFSRNFNTCETID